MTLLCPSFHLSDRLHNTLSMHPVCCYSNGQNHSLKVVGREDTVWEQKSPAGSRGSAMVEGMGAGAFILGGLGEQSPTFLKVGVDRLVISTNLLRLDRQIFAWKVKCALQCQMWGGVLPPIVGVRRPCMGDKVSRNSNIFLLNRLFFGWLSHNVSFVQ